MFSSSPPARPIGGHGGRAHGEQRAAPKWARIAPVSGYAPPPRSVHGADGSATVFGTGMLSRISRCRHFARPPWTPADIGTSGVISVTFGASNSFCLRASFAATIGPWGLRATKRETPLASTCDRSATPRADPDTGEQVQAVAPQNLVVALTCTAFEEGVGIGALRPARCPLAAAKSSSAMASVICGGGVEGRKSALPSGPSATSDRPEAVLHPVRPLRPW